VGEPALLEIVEKMIHAAPLPGYAGGSG
jgi:hypothetical protein